MRLRNLDLIAGEIIAVLNVLWALQPAHPGWAAFVGVVLALPLVFILPGYMLTSALFARRTLSTVQRLILGMGLSLALDIASGFLLNVLPGGLQTLSWAVVLGVLTTVFALLAAFRRRDAQLPGTQPAWRHFSISATAVLGLAVAVAILSVLYSIAGAQQQPRPGFTQLWMLPAVQTNSGCAVQLGVRSFENAPVSYSITITMNGNELQTWTSFRLAPQQIWDQVVRVAGVNSHSMYLEVHLYRLDHPQFIYRTVHLTLYSAAGNAQNKECSAT